jgi:D-alanyl-D-alanine carboxypeptidase
VVKDMAKKRKYRIKKKPVIILIIIILLIIGLIHHCTNKMKEEKYKQTIEYKLIQVGYEKDEIELLKEKTNEDFMNSLLTVDYDQEYLEILREKYYMKSHLNDYINYYEDNLQEDSNSVVTKVNIGYIKPWYENIKETDVSKDILMINNKVYKLPDKYVPNDLVTISNRYAYGTNPQLRKEAYDAFVNMFNAAKLENLTIIINSAYRSYDYQVNLYNQYLKNYGQDYTDKYAARPGHSEHQTGLTVDVTTYGANADNFDKTEVFTWLQNHAHEYGFILRYPKGKEEITGYQYESWHYRYLGIETATKVHDEGITYDEYYAYYLDK